MASLSEIESWKASIHQEDDNDDPSLIAALFDACSHLFSALICSLQEQNVTDSNTIRSLDRSHCYFVLWADGHRVQNGGFDASLDKSRRARGLTFRHLDSICRTLTRRLFQYIDAGKEPDISHMVEQVEKYAEKLRYLRQDDDKHGSESDTSSETASTESTLELEEIAEDLETDTQSLLSLGPRFEEPTVGLMAEEKITEPTAVDTWNLAHSFTDRIRWRYPACNVDIAARLGKANWDRLLRYQAVKEENILQQEQQAVSTTESADQQSKYGTRDSGLGSSVPTNTGRVLPAPSTFAPTIMSYNGERGDTVRVPPLPEGAKHGKPFSCVGCGKLVKITRSSEWKKHLFSDLRPYMCLETHCAHATTAFETKSHWMNHLQFEHGFWESGEPIVCSLCNETIRDRGIAAMRHLSAHLEEISLAILPANAESEDGSVSDSQETRQKGDNHEENKDNSKDSESSISDVEAVKTEEEYEVEHILAEEENPEKPGTLQFLVKWASFPLENATWEPEENIQQDLYNDWLQNKAEIQAGKKEAFDVREYNDAVAKAQRSSLSDRSSAQQVASTSAHPQRHHSYDIPRGLALQSEAVKRQRPLGDVPDFRGGVWDFTSNQPNDQESSGLKGVTGDDGRFLDHFDNNVSDAPPDSSWEGTTNLTGSRDSPARPTVPFSPNIHPRHHRSQRHASSRPSASTSASIFNLFNLPNRGEEAGFLRFFNNAIPADEDISFLGQHPATGGSGVNGLHVPLEMPLDYNRRAFSSAKLTTDSHLDTATCFACRDKHLKCDGKYPCSQCIMSSSEACMYTTYDGTIWGDTWPYPDPARNPEKCPAAEEIAFPSRDWFDYSGDASKEPSADHKNLDSDKRARSMIYEGAVGNLEAIQQDLSTGAHYQLSHLSVAPMISRDEDLQTEPSNPSSSVHNQVDGAPLHQVRDTSDESTNPSFATTQDNVRLKEQPNIVPSIEEKKRNKLNYSRTFMACRYCRHRKVRCKISPTENPGGKCNNCIRMGQECIRPPVYYDDEATPAAQDIEAQDAQTSGLAVPQVWPLDSLNPHDMHLHPTDPLPLPTTAYDVEYILNPATPSLPEFPKLSAWLEDTQGLYDLAPEDPAGTSRASDAAETSREEYEPKREDGNESRSVDTGYHQSQDK